MSAIRAVRSATPPAAVPEMAGGFNPHLGAGRVQRAEGVPASTVRAVVKVATPIELASLTRERAKTVLWPL
jgi:hypothetical protein